jgi:hypothetical protein
MTQVYRYDSDGFYLEPVKIENSEEIPDNCTEDKPEDGLYKAKFENGTWVEGLSQAEIDVIKNDSKPFDPIEEIKKQQELMQSALDDLILGGVL